MKTLIKQVLIDFQLITVRVCVVCVCVCAFAWSRALECSTGFPFTVTNIVIVFRINDSNSTMISANSTLIRETGECYVLFVVWLSTAISFHGLAYCF